MNKFQPEKDSLPLVPDDPSDGVVQSLMNDYEDAVYDRLRNYDVGIRPHVLLAAVFHNLDKRVSQVRKKDDEQLEGQELDARLMFGEDCTDYLDLSRARAVLTRIAMDENATALFSYDGKNLTAKVYDPTEEDRDETKIVTSKLPAGDIVAPDTLDSVLVRRAGVVRLDNPDLAETQVKALKIKSIHDKIKNWDDFPEGIFDPFDAIVTGLLKMKEYRGANHPVIPVIQSTYRVTKKSTSGRKS